MVGEVLALMLFAIFIVGHLRATWSVCNDMSKKIDEMEQEKNKQYNQIWFGAWWRLCTEIMNIKKVIHFKK